MAGTGAGRPGCLWVDIRVYEESRQDKTGAEGKPMSIRVLVAGCSFVCMSHTDRRLDRDVIEKLAVVSCSSGKTAEVDT